MKIESFEALLQTFKVFRSEVLPDDIGATIRTAERINQLSGRTVFDAEAMKKLTETPVNQQIEDYYTFMLRDLIGRNKMFHKLKEEYQLHVLVSDFLEIYSNMMDKDVFIVIEWPYIKYIDMFSKEILYAQPNEFAENIEFLFHSFAKKYISGNKEDKSFHLRRGDNPVLYQLRSYIVCIQELFMLGHELGHLLLRDSGHDSEQEADKIAFEALMGYCRNEAKIIPFVLCSVMLLFSYMTWLDAARRLGRGEDDLNVDQWMDRYDYLYDIMKPYYDVLKDKDKALVDGYENIRNEIDTIGERFLHDFYESMLE